MGKWTIKLTNRTDGVTMLGNITPTMELLAESGKTFSSAFTLAYCCYTSDNKFTVNDNVFTVQNNDNGFEEDGGVTVTLLEWIPNNAQLKDINKIAGIKNIVIISRLV